MASLTMDWGLLLNSVTAISIVIGIVFAVLQLRQSERKRREILTFEVLKRLEDKEFRSGLFAITSLPDSISLADHRKFPLAEREAVLHVMNTLDRIGYMVGRGIIEVDLVHDSLGLQHIWSKVAGIVRDKRAETDGDGGDGTWEWFEWLVDRSRGRPHFRPPQRRRDQPKAPS